MTNEKEILSNYIQDEITEIPNMLNKKISKNNKKFNSRYEIENIRKKIDNFISGNRTNRFIVLPGLRGIGKTTILYQIYDYLLKEKNIPPKQILYLSCDDLNNLMPCNIHQVVEIYLEKIHESTLRSIDKDIFLLIDESQYDKNWSLSGKIIYDKSDKIFMIFTGSSALNLEYNADSARRMNKKIITPLNYTQHLKLKYNIDLKDVSKSLEKLLFTGDVEDAIKYEKIANDTLMNHVGYSITDWNEFLKYGGFPALLNENDHDEVASKLIDISEKIINTDLMNLKNISSENQANAKRILRHLALQEPGEISQNKLSNYLRTSAGNVKNILDILEKTQLIYHSEPYGGASKRIKKAWKYYFATSSLHNVLASRYNNHMKKQDQFEGILIENLIASTLFNYQNKDNLNNFSIYYDGHKDDNVDFIIKQEFDKIIPIEVGKGSKKKTQVLNAMTRYGSDYGLIISQTTDSIVKKDDVIYIPIKTFSLL